MKASNSGGGSFIDSSNDEACLLAKNVEQFDVKVNPDEEKFCNHHETSGCTDSSILYSGWSCQP